ncbi:hypothetical protein I203_106434 [Kwoniella mangroviensis CBS 8507]|uniref:uncharacterized protein n=1 Tax=Kwoniella mangroviensis CBS 8507 TaxID=1296122 RepID=UPI0030647E91
MVKRSLSTSPPPSSPEQIKPSSPFSSIDERSSPKKSPRKSNTINNNEESWDADKRSVMSERTGLTTKQLRDALKFRHEGGTNLRSHLIKSVIPK